ncbi:ATP-grasp domain-containing protein [Actinoplanes solisilvae]|uniref:ATP-grasp domain-containing protein n=1 Tax=Actinoplanes solisilvae TaxID=2486853 RepID=UPI0013E2E0DA|nr:ATP-grasp domain-containing protein [Actinoplanes solisilvae]
MPGRVGVVSRFNAWSADDHPFRSPLKRLGIDYVPIRLGDIQLSTRSGGRPELTVSNSTNSSSGGLAFPDVDAVLWRVSENLFPRCYALAAALAERVPVVNPFFCLRNCSDKWLTHRLLEAVGLPTVPTQLVLPDNVVPDFGTPMTIVKPAQGAGGRGVRAESPGSSFESDEAYIAQPELYSDPARHVRVLVCGGRAVAAIHRTPADPATGPFAVNNLDAGGIETIAKIDPVADIAVAAADAVQGIMVGVDLVLDENDEYLILEVNSSPGLEGVNRSSEADIYQLAAEAVRASIESSGGAPREPAVE